MTSLETECMNALPLTTDEVQRIYNQHKMHGGGIWDVVARRVIGRLCLSHERLRSELAGAEPGGPRWMERPSGPGLWISQTTEKNWVPYLVLNLTQKSLDSGSPFWSKQVYGPIPMPVE